MGDKFLLWCFQHIDKKMCVTILQFKFDESSKNLLYLYVLLANTLISRCCSAGKFNFAAFHIADN